jgi:hypothetical protein
MGVVKDLLVWVFSKRALGWFFGSKRARAASSRWRGLQIKYNGKWLTSQKGKSGVYEFHGLSEAEARGVFRELTAGRKINPITQHKQGWNIDHMGYRIGDKKYSITYRTEASSSGAHSTIELSDFKFGYKKIKFKNP